MLCNQWWTELRPVESRSRKNTNVIAFRNNTTTEWKPLSLFTAMFLPPDPKNIAEVCNFLPASLESSLAAETSSSWKSVLTLQFLVYSLRAVLFSLKWIVSRMQFCSFRGNTRLKLLSPPFEKGGKNFLEPRTPRAKMQLKGVCFKEIQKKEESLGSLFKKF